jgi:branched-chain amino acid transport system permease protein
LFAFTAAILGGIGSPLGALASGLSLGITSAFSDYVLQAQWTPVLLQALLIGLLVLRPTGFSGDLTEAVTAPRDAVMVATRQPTVSFFRSRWFYGGLLLLIGGLPLFFDIHWQIIATGIGVYALLALGLNVLLGFAGVLDLGYAVSFGLGGYTAAALMLSRGRPEFILVALVSMAVAMGFGLLKGLLTQRVRDDYLAVITLALGLLMRRAVINLDTFSGGIGGIAALPPPKVAGTFLADPTTQYYLIVGVVVLVALFVRQLAQSPIGRAWHATSEDETAAAASGLPVARYRLLGVVISAAIAGLAGALYASLFAYVAPDQMDFHVSALTLAMVILGGVGSVPGAILGAVLIAGYDRLLIPWLGQIVTTFGWGQLALGSAPDIRGASYFSFGLALYLTVLWRGRRRTKSLSEN